MINAADFNSLEDLSNYVIKGDDDDTLYNQYIDQAPTTKRKLKKLFKAGGRHIHNITQLPNITNDIISP